jgi:hypothetical protein
LWDAAQLRFLIRQLDESASDHQSTYGTSA